MLFEISVIPLGGDIHLSDELAGVLSVVDSSGLPYEMKRGRLRSGRSGKKLTSRKQAVAIGLSQARRSGGKLPPAPRGRGAGEA